MFVQTFFRIHTDFILKSLPCFACVWWIEVGLKNAMGRTLNWCKSRRQRLQRGTHTHTHTHTHTQYSLTFVHFSHPLFVQLFDILKLMNWSRFDARIDLQDDNQHKVQTTGSHFWQKRTFLIAETLRIFRCAFVQATTWWLEEALSETQLPVCAGRDVTWSHGFPRPLPISLELKRVAQRKFWHDVQRGSRNQLHGAVRTEPGNCSPIPLARNGFTPPCSERGVGNFKVNAVPGQLFDLHNKTQRELYSGYLAHQV